MISNSNNAVDKTLTPHLFKIAGDRTDLRVWLNLVGVLCAAGLLLSRAPDHLLHPQLWGEDGVFWVSQAYNLGFRCLAIPESGYLQTISRIGALLAIQLPLTAVPFIFSLIAFVIQLAPVALLLSRRGEQLIPSLLGRLLIVLLYIGEPNSSEAYVNLTNAMWHLALVAFLLVILPKPRTTTGLWLDAVVLILAGLSGPLVLFIAPIAWWELVRLRRCTGRAKTLLYAGVLTSCAVVQGILIAMTAMHTTEARLGQLGANFSRLVHILADQIILGGVVGGKTVERLLTQNFWLHTWPATLCCLLALVLGLIAFVKGQAAYRQFVVLSALIMASALKSPMVSMTAPQWELMQRPGAGDRYYIIPILAWGATLLVLSTGKWRFGLQWFARGIMLYSTIGIVNDWHYFPYTHTNYYDSARIFDRATPGVTIEFFENPVPWHFFLTKK
ncbi:MAG TPA: hypothetical protein VNC39_17240 [Acidocella sp.]|uniref:hypothetical protein n=1 Tax=Acidocella sp. TaxID=50710 RepID=UPI002CA5FDA3|nr:hypothetical protein [Acidocella sp.]HVE23716.1 hypothetical protein [Acidocella sp.]